MNVRENRRGNPEKLATMDTYVKHRTKTDKNKKTKKMSKSAFIHNVIDICRLRVLTVLAIREPTFFFK